MSALLNFTPTASSAGAASSVSTAFALPGSGPTVLVSNLGQFPIIALLGSSSAVAVTLGTGVPIMPGQQLALGVGANTFIALMTAGSQSPSTPFNLTSGA
jgi:hypothetical protein